MSVLIKLSPILYGIRPRKPIWGIPRGAKHRLRMRSDEFMTLRVRSRKGRTVVYTLQEKGDHWESNFPLTTGKVRIRGEKVYIS